MDEIRPTERTTLRRKPERAVYQRDAVYRILDEALFCHVAYVADSSPVVVPTIHARLGDVLYLHGSAASRTMRRLKIGSEVCVAVTILDGLVLARSGFNHSMNYRSVIAFGRVREVMEGEEKRRALDALVDHIVDGRSSDARKPDDTELKQTTVLAMDLEEASAKVRTGPPKDDEDDYELPVWAGVLPMRIVAGEPVDDPHLSPGLVAPENVRSYRRASAVAESAVSGRFPNDVGPEA